MRKILLGIFLLFPIALIGMTALNAADSASSIIIKPNATDDQRVYNTGETLELTLAYNSSATVDVYVAVLLPTGDLYCLNNTFQIFGSVNTAEPYLRSVTASAPDTKVLSMVLPEIPIGRYDIYAIMTPSNASPEKQENWLAYNTTGFYFKSKTAPAPTPGGGTNVHDFNTTLTVGGVENLNGVTAYRVDELDGNGQPTNSNYYSSDNNGIYFIKEKDLEDNSEVVFSKPILRIPAVMNIGDHVSSAFTATTDGQEFSGEYHCWLLGVEDVTRNGTAYKNCLKIATLITAELGGLKLRETEVVWLGKGVGLVKRCAADMLRSNDVNDLEMESGVLTGAAVAGVNYGNGTGSEGAATGPFLAADYFPLTPGTSWNYANQEREFATNDIDKKTGENRISILGQTSFAGVNVWQLKEEENGGSDYDVTFLNWTASGLFEYGSEFYASVNSAAPQLMGRSVSNDTILYIPASASIGTSAFDTFSEKETNNDGSIALDVTGKAIVKIIGQEDMRLADGTVFGNCLKVLVCSVTDGGQPELNIGTHWVAKGVGVVRTEEIEVDFSDNPEIEMFEQLLISATVNGTSYGNGQGATGESLATFNLQDYFPLAANNEWRYSGEVLSGDFFADDNYYGGDDPAPYQPTPADNSTPVPTYDYTPYPPGNDPTPYPTPVPTATVNFPSPTVSAN